MAKLKIIECVLKAVSALISAALAIIKSLGYFNKIKHPAIA